MTTAPAIAGIIEAVKADAQDELAKLIATVQEELEPEQSLRNVEMALWRQHVVVGRTLLALRLAEECRRCTERDLEARGLSWEDVQVRVDRDYWVRITTTFGPVYIPLFAYRERRAGVSVTHAPARRLFRLYPRCRSSELLLEWEARLGKEFPFRQAEQMLSFFTHEAAALEDTTIAAHMTAIGQMVDPAWLYRSPEEIRTILRERATRDAENGRPLIYFSTDAHALRRFVDETWAAAWKMANGVRIWCVDRFTGAVIHLGGEYTWGDCNVVAAIVDRLIASGILPRDADYGDGLLAQLVVVTDGLEWIENHVVPRLPWAVVVLDIYHVLEHLAEFAAAYFGKATEKARRWLRRCREIIFGRKPTPNRRRRPKPRRGQRRPRRNPEAPRASSPAAAVANPEGHAGEELVLELLATHSQRRDSRQQEGLDDVLRYLRTNTHRTDYRRYRARGLQIGSGAMESLHRTASQLRLKVPGPGWLAENAQAVFNLRMLDLVGNWDKFWARPDLTDLLAHAFDADDQSPPDSESAREEKLSA